MMSNVPKSDRKPTRFETQHNLIKLRDEVTKICINDFGYSEEKYLAQREKYKQQCLSLSNADELLEKYDRKAESFNRWFIDDECRSILHILRDVVKEFTLGNSIYPNNSISGLSEYIERRKHITQAIGLCYMLKQEINYVVRILPVDKNKYKNISEDVDRQINLFKGVRRSDNRFLKSFNSNKWSLRDVITYLVGNELIT